MKVLQVCVGLAAPLAVGSRTVLSGIVKSPVDGAVAVRRTGLAGDEQADPTVHGGIAKAVYAYPVEHHAFWQTVRAQAGVADWGAALPPGLFGENLVVEGLTEDRLWIGDRLIVGAGGAGGSGCVLAVSEPRLPCHKLGARMGFAHASRLMVQSAWSGFYLGVVAAGTVRAGDAIELLPGPRDVNLRELFRARAPSGTAAR